MKRVWAAVGLVAISTAAASEPVYESAGARMGLPVQAITALRVDHAGFLWIGSRAGLYRYDGYEVRPFVHEPSDPDSLSDAAVRAIGEDPQGFLWIGTNTGGVDRLDPSSGRCVHFRHGGPSSIASDFVSAVLVDRTGAVWVGSDV